MTTEQTNIILTRYLYNKIDVKQSLLLALLEHNHEEALFWGYELYYSGFENDAFVYLSNIYEFIYSFQNEFIREALRKIITQWKSNNSEDWHIGSIIMTLSSRNYNLKYFMKAYFDYDSPEYICDKKNNFIIHLKEKDIEKYKTVSNVIPSNYLALGCKYPIRKEVNDIFNFVEISRKEFELYWLYHCRDTPFWIDNIINYDGMIDDFNKHIEFPNDTLCDAFYDKWNIEPDDQPEYIYDYCVGKKDIIQLSFDDFYNKYKQYQNVSKITIKPIMRTDLTNSMIYK